MPESRVESVADCWSGEMGAEVGRPLVRLLMDGRPCGWCCCGAVEVRAAMMCGDGAQK